MIVRLFLWNLADSKTNIEELRRYLRDEAVDSFDSVPGLLFKAWISDEVTERWGAVYVWESREAYDAFREQRLLPAIQKVSGQDPTSGPMPTITEFAVHNYVKP